LLLVDEPARNEKLGNERPRSLTLTGTLIELDRDPPVPVKRTPYPPKGPEPVQVVTVEAEPGEGTDRVIELAPPGNEQLTPLDEGDSVTVTLPEYPLLVTVMVDCCCEPRVIAREAGFAEREKLHGTFVLTGEE